MHMIKVGRQAGLGQEQWERAGREGAMHLIPKLYRWRHQASADCIHYGEGDRSRDVSDLLGLRDHFASTLIGLIVLRPKTYSRRWATKQTVSFLHSPFLLPAIKNSRLRAAISLLERVHHSTKVISQTTCHRSDVGPEDTVRLQGVRRACCAPAPKTGCGIGLP